MIILYEPEAHTDPLGPGIVTSQVYISKLPFDFLRGLATNPAIDYLFHILRSLFKRISKTSSLIIST